MVLRVYQEFCLLQKEKITNCRFFCSFISVKTQEFLVNVTCTLKVMLKMLENNICVLNHSWQSRKCGKNGLIAFIYIIILPQKVTCEFLAQGCVTAWKVTISSLVCSLDAWCMLYLSSAGTAAIRDFLSSLSRFCM